MAKNVGSQSADTISTSAPLILKTENLKKAISQLKPTESSAPEQVAQRVHQLWIQSPLKVSEELIMKVISCEGKAYRNPGWIHKNNNGTYDFGPAQINSVHLPEMHRLGLSESRWEDTVTFMFILLKRNGLNDYSASKTCWSTYDQ